MGRNKVIRICLTLIQVTTITSLTCDEIVELPEEKKVTLSELASTQPKHIVECLAHLGKDKLPMAEASYIWQTIVKWYAGAANIPDRDLMLLHWITPAVQPDDYVNITLSNIDVIQNFGLNYELTGAQLSAIADRVKEDFASKEPEDYTYYDLMALRQILCAFNRSEIERIHPAAYREASVTIGKLQNCGSEVMQGFARLAVQQSAFGHPATWSRATVKTVGEVFNYLPKQYIDKLTVTAIERI